MSTFVQFIPSTTTPFSFQAQLANGNQYIITVTWNIFGQRYFVTVTDVAGNLIIHRGLSASGPQLNALFTWASSVATAVCAVQHNVTLGSIAKVNVANTGDTYDADGVMALAINSTTFNFQLNKAPMSASALPGNFNFDLDLLGGYGIGKLLYHEEIQQFEF